MFGPGASASRLPCTPSHRARGRNASLPLDPQSAAIPDRNGRMM
ncbi:MAG: hypothetical protein AB1411_04990 [Nitrospirota bacterium]